MTGSAMLPAFKGMGPSHLGSRLASVVLAALAGSLGAGGSLALAPLGSRAQAVSPAAIQPAALKPIAVQPAAVKQAPVKQAAVKPASTSSLSRQVIPVRWTSGVGAWSLHPEAVRRFVETGVVSDRSLDSAINRSGWSPEELRLGLAKPYSVDLVALARFLYSSDGLAFLRTQTRGYAPSNSQSNDAVAALRSAIIAAAAGGQISALAIMAHLPTDFSTGQTCGPGDGRVSVCASSQCIGEAQCTSLLSWYVFLPACLQANQARLASPTALIPLGKGPKPELKP